MGRDESDGMKKRQRKVIYHTRGDDTAMMADPWVVKRQSTTPSQIQKNMVDYSVVLTEPEAVAVSVNIIEDYIEDCETRKMLWRTIFGNDNLPKQEADAVDKYAGSLKKSLPDVSVEEIEEAIREAKEK